MLSFVQRAAFNGDITRKRYAYPALIGRRDLCGRFVVDVSRHEGIHPIARKATSGELNKELAKDPLALYEKYYSCSDSDSCYSRF